MVMCLVYTTNWGHFYNYDYNRINKYSKIPSVNKIR